MSPDAERGFRDGPFPRGTDKPEATTSAAGWPERRSPLHVLLPVATSEKTQGYNRKAVSWVAGRAEKQLPSQRSSRDLEGKRGGGTPDMQFCRSHWRTRGQHLCEFTENTPRPSNRVSIVVSPVLGHVTFRE